MNSNSIKFSFSISFQSVILLSRLPFVNLFYEVLALIAPKYFSGGENVLQNTCLDISNWPSLQAGECIQLPLLGKVFQTFIPSLTSSNLQQPYASAPVIAPNQMEDLNITVTNMVKVNDTHSMNEECNDPGVNKTDDQNQSIDNRASNSEVVLSREHILDNYKQSKELLAQKIKIQSESPCDSNSSKSNGANNANDYENENGDEADVDLDEYFDDHSNDDKLDEPTNTQINIERPLRTQQTTPIVLSSVTEIDIFRSLYTVLSYTHLLWELVLTAEPIVVMATSPSDCSHMVQSLMR